MNQVLIADYSPLAATTNKYIEKAYCPSNDGRVMTLNINDSMEQQIQKRVFSKR
jgi:hypothetical protein